jgi:ABC-2 type transport system permease protein
VRRSSRRSAVNPAWATVIQCFAFVRKELAEIVRQPLLVALLVLGPFVLLLLFGIGYRDEQLQMRTLFVGPAGSFYEDAVVEYEDVLAGFVDSQGFTSDEASARQRLADGELDVVVVFPADPLDSVLAGEAAEIEILHDKIDPIQQIGVEISAELAVQEVNASVVSAVVGRAQEVLAPSDDLVAALVEAASDLTAAASTDPARVQTVAGTIADTADELEGVLRGSGLVLERLGASGEAGRPPVVDQLAAISSEARALSAADAGDVAARSDALAATIDEVAAAVPTVTALDPEVIVQPFEGVTANVVAADIQPVDYYTPASIALLLQHLAVTFAALSLVRDRRLGLFELLRAGPLSSFEILAGKTVAYVLVGFAVGGLLVAAAVYGLDVPYEGAVLSGAITVVLVLLASLCLGLLISLLARTETQAVQIAMLTLLAGLFFGGFMLSLDGLAYPVRALSWLLPVTYGIRMLQDVMFRGAELSGTDLAGLGALVVVYGGLATLLLRRRLRRI